MVPDRRPGVFEHSRHSVWLFGMAFPVVVMGNNTWELFSSIDFLLITVFTVFTLHAHIRLTALFSGTTRVSRYQKGKPIRILLSGSGISWAICKSAPRCRQITMPAPHHSVFYRPDALPAAKATASEYLLYSANSCENQNACPDYRALIQITMEVMGTHWIFLVGVYL